MASPFSLTPQPTQSPGFSFSLQPQPQPQPQPQQPQQQQQQQVHLLTKDNNPVTYHTKWSDLHPDSQNFLIQIETRIMEYRDESRRLDQCDRLFDSVALNEGFEVDAVRISQDLGGISTAMDRYKVSLQELMKTAKEMMRNTEVAVRSFVILRSRFPRMVGSAGTSTGGASNAVVPATGTTGTGPTASTLPTDFYSGVPIKPSPFLVHTVTRFEHQLQEFKQWLEELERLVFTDPSENGKTSSQLSLLQSLPTVIKNIHDFFIYVAAKVETLHQQTWSMRTTYLSDQRKRGEYSNPFLEADRREVAKREAAAKRVHPTLQAATQTNQISSQAAGLISTAPPASSPLLTSSTGTPFQPSASSPFAALTPAASSFSSASASSFAAPSSSLFGSSSAATSSVFGSSGTSSSSLFGSGTSASVFGSGSALGTTTPVPGFGASAASSSGGLFGSTPLPSSGLFGSTPLPSSGLFGSSTPSFGTPSTGNIFGAAGASASAGGSVFGIGTSQGTTTAKPKSRTTRRK